MCDIGCDDSASRKQKTRSLLKRSLSLYFNCKVTGFAMHGNVFLLAFSSHFVCEPFAKSVQEPMDRIKSSHSLAPPSRLNTFL